MIRGTKNIVVILINNKNMDKDLEQKIKDEHTYQVLVDTSPDCIKLFDLEGNLLFINKGGLKEHNLESSEKAVADKWKAIETLVEEDRPKLLKAFEEAKKGNITDIEIRHTHEGANRDVCLETIAPVKDEAGNIIAIFGVSRDISYLKKIEKQLEEKILAVENMKVINEEWYQKMIDQEMEIMALKNKLGEKDF
jgi:PAS domain S-box-containing protein